MPNQDQQPKTGWSSTITKLSLSALAFLTVTGLLIAYVPFHAAMEWGVLIHTLIGLLVLLPIVWYSWIHWADYRQYNLSDALLLGYVALLALVLCLASGLVVTWQGLFGIRMSPTWRAIHLYSAWAALVTGLPHVLLVWIRTRQREPRPSPGPAVWHSIAATVVGLAAIALLGVVYPGQEYVNELPEDYSYLYGDDRPFAPSLAMTATGGGLDPESLAGSNSCGTSNCHSQILAEWKPSAHRYSAMDPLFQKVQSVMAEQNGPESTRYCGGCHDPISLFSGAKNIFTENLTSLHGYNEGISCLVCHGVRETDLQGNANYVMTQPSVYLWQWSEAGAGKFLSDFLIRTYPDEHNKLSKRMFKAPEYCAACHKQFIDQE
ncbi:MAG: multiheme c-type cytochrome, partial [Thermoanaerobaculia bacterium]